jgi:hypothetical protein
LKTGSLEPDDVEVSPSRFLSLRVVVVKKEGGKTELKRAMYEVGRLHEPHTPNRGALMSLRSL